MKIKFNLKTGLSLTEEETKEYLKVAEKVATNLCQYEPIRKMVSDGKLGSFSVTKSDKMTEKKSPATSNRVKTYADLDLKKIADEAVKEAIHSMHVFSATKPGDERTAKSRAMRIFHKKTGLGYCVAEQVINDAYCRSKTFSYDDRNAEEIKRDAQSYCIKKEHHLPEITEAEARYCSVWEIWRRHKNERWFNRPDDKKVRMSSSLVSKCMEYIPISTLEMWDYRSNRCQDYDFHKRLVVTSMIVATSIKFAEAIVTAFRDVDRMSIENERISKLNK